MAEQNLHTRSPRLEFHTAQDALFRKTRFKRRTTDPKNSIPGSSGLQISSSFKLVSGNRTIAKDEESVMVIKLRRLFPCGKRGDSDKMKELKLRLRHHLPHEILQPGREFQEVFDALTLKKKIALGEYSFLCDVFSEIHMEAGMITQEYQANIIDILGPQISEQKQDSLFDKKTVVSGKLSILKKIDYSKIVENAVNKYSSELDEELECQENVEKMAQVALYEKKS